MLAVETEPSNHPSKDRVRSADNRLVVMFNQLVEHYCKCRSLPGHVLDVVEKMQGREVKVNKKQMPSA